MSLICPSPIASLDPALCTAVDHYCERHSAALFAEPANAYTNLAFLVAAWAAWQLQRSHAATGSTGLVHALIIATAMAGFGSFLFHTIATRWAEWGDVIPILVFMLLFVWLILTRLFAWRLWMAVAVLAVFFAATIYLEASVPGSVLWGGALYLPALFALIAIGFGLYWRKARAGLAMVLAILVFLLSFAARTLDMPVCGRFPLGTHFIWHLLNATLLYLLVRLCILYVPDWRWPKS